MAIAILALSLPLRADNTVTITTILPATEDLPEIHSYLTDSNGDILEGDDNQGNYSYDIQAVLDTGTSGILLSQETQQEFGINLDSFDGQPITFNDIAIGGTTSYSVSVPYTVNIAPFTVNDDQNLLEDPPPESAYTTSYGPDRFEVNQSPANPDAGPIDIMGMAIMQNKVTVIDNRNTSQLLGDPSSYIYAPNTPYQPSTLDTNPGIVPTQYHVKLSSALLTQFTSVSPAGAPGPVYNTNPFIGPNPLNQLNPNAPPDNTPPVAISYNGLNATGSFLFDTGAELSFISTALAAKLNVEYAPGTQNTDDADLINSVTGQDIPNQFSATVIGATGNEVPVEGFYLSSLTLQTVEGVPLKFATAPVLVEDITLQEPGGGPSITLDGDLGMNFFEPSFDPNELEFIDLGGNNSPFDWVEFDQPDGLLGLQLAGVPLIPVGTWNSTTGGTWNQASNWQGSSIPITTYQTINFTSAITAPSTITLDGAWTAGTINFDNTNSYTIAAGNNGTLTLQTQSGNAAINDSGGTHTISAPMIFASNVVVTVTNAGDTMNLSGKISGSGGLTTAGSGTVNLSGTNTYTGPTAAGSGTLIVSALASLPNNTSLSIGTTTTSAAVKLPAVHGRVRLSGLSINTGSTLDISSNAVVLNYIGTSPESTIQSYVTGGLIESSFVATNPGFGIAYADGGDAGLENNILQPGQMVIEPDLLGDADLNGTVTFHDLQDLLTGFGHAGYWDQGNFNGHATVDFNDLQLLLGNFNNSTGLAFDELTSIENLVAQFGEAAIPNSDGVGFTLATVPEPASALLLLAPLSLLLWRRHVRQHSGL